MSQVKLGLLAASPLYYQAPLYRKVAQDSRIDFTAIFASSGGVKPHDAGFGKPIEWDIDILTGYRSKFLKRADSNPIDGSFLALRDFDIVEVLRSEDFDVLWIHGYNFLTHQMAAWTQILTGRKLLIREEQNLFHPRSRWKQAAKQVGLRLLFSRSYGLYIGTRNKRWFEYYGLPNERLFDVPYCVDNSRFRLAADELSASKESLRACFGIASNSGPVISIVARLIPKKNLHFLLDAFTRLRSKQQCTLLIAGSGELEESLRLYVHQKGIQDVVFAGFLNQSQISQVYASSDIFVLASAFDETWGLVANEAMNFSLPIVLTEQVGSSPDLVSEGINGYVVSSTDPDQLACKLGCLVSSAELRAKFGKESLRIVSDYNYERAAQGVLNATAHAVGNKRWDKATRFAATVRG